MDLERCIKALRATGDNKEEAANRLLMGGAIEEVEDVEAPSMFLGNLSSRYRRAEAVGRRENDGANGRGVVARGVCSVCSTFYPLCCLLCPFSFLLMQSNSPFCSCCRMIPHRPPSPFLWADTAPTPPQPPAIDFADRAHFNGVTYERHFDPYDERPHCGLDKAEHWIADVLQPVLLAVYPPFPPDKKMNYKLLLPSETLPARAREARLLGCVNNEKENATWKEVVVQRDRGLVLAYNLISHGRRVFRTLIYCSDHRFSLHSLKLNTDPSAAPRPPALLKQAGVFKAQRAHEPSLLIMRRNTAIQGHETLIPQRLLAGLVPGALLESHRFWRGEDGLIRAEPQEAESQWFDYQLLLRLEEDASGQGGPTPRARLQRLPTSVTVPVADAREKITEGSMLVRQSSVSRPAPKAESFNEESVAELVSLGFTAAAARQALRESQHNKARAANWLFDPANMAAISAAVREEAREAGGAAAAAAAAETAVDEGLVEALKDMGFSRPASRRALAIYGQLEEALSWLADEANAAEIQQIEMAAAQAESSEAAAASSMEVDEPETAAAAAAAAADAAGAAADAPLRSVQEALEQQALDLLELSAAAPGSLLFRLASVLTRIEDLSHILVWGRPDAPGSDLSHIASVELPRLKIRFSVAQTQEGQLRLALDDQAGWYVSDVLDGAEEDGLPEPCRVRLQKLVHGLEHSLLLDDGAGAFMVFLPNHDVYRPPVEGAPFSGALLYDRGAMGWMSTMDTRYYLYPVHSSFNHLNSGSLASTLYMALIQLLARQYHEAFSWIAAASTDTDLTPEEAWIFEQFERTVADRHPEALAIRLKLSLALMYSDTPSK